ncbi:hypothetical protein [Caulobacter sp.]|uniref:hypothetical protein n=1 Tax=Caulobacter sp. TaxID=78 RepID=UPI001B2B0860|nr:hypothetical protein [Caulobacter sp.]MBO9547481.1 hypothetical protein [Caulobacter sp.]
MTQLLIPARHARMFGKGRHRKRRLPNGDQIWLDMIDRVLTILDEAEHDMRVLTKDYPPHILAGYLADAAETRRELESQRRDILLNPMPRAREKSPTRPR